MINKVVYVFVRGYLRIFFMDCVGFDCIFRLIFIIKVISSLKGFLFVIRRRIFLVKGIYVDFVVCVF